MSFRHRVQDADHVRHTVAGATQPTEAPPSGIRAIARKVVSIAAAITPAQYSISNAEPNCKVVSNHELSGITQLSPECFDDFGASRLMEAAVFKSYRQRQTMSNAACSP